MAKANMDLRETNTIGRLTRERIVSPQVCPALAGHGISLCGVSDASADFCFVRLRPHIAQVLACISGTGQVMVDGQLVPCPAGTAYLTPTGQPHAYHASPAGNWRVAWIHYAEQDMHGPALVSADAQALGSAIEGLYRESMGVSEPAVMLNWATLVASLGRRIMGPLLADPRLQKLWERVDADLAHPWTNGELASLAGVSAEHLRRLCSSHLHISPMRHLTALRMRRADALLRTDMYSVQAVAHLVGYEDAFAFSTAFRRHFGIPPSQVVL